MGDDLFAASSGHGRLVVVVHDPVTDETDAYGPMSEWQAVLDADRRRRELDAEDLDDVFVVMVPVQGSRVPQAREGSAKADVQRSAESDGQASSSTAEAPASVVARRAGVAHPRPEIPR